MQHMKQLVLPLTTTTLGEGLLNLIQYLLLVTWPMLHKQEVKSIHTTKTPLQTCGMWKQIQAMSLMECIILVKKFQHMNVFYDSTQPSVKNEQTLSFLYSLALPYVYIITFKFSLLKNIKVKDIK